MAGFEYRNRFVELPQNRVWRSYQGGRILDGLAGKRDPRDSHYPEDWLASVTIADNPEPGSENEGISRVRVGGREMLFPELIDMDPEYFLGAGHVSRFGKQPMVLVKLLDSAVRLQLQVHPTAEFARQYLGSDSGKAEAYYILDVRAEVEDPYVYLGFQRPPGREEFRHCVEEQDLERLEGYFDRIAVSPGDVLLIPGGIPHAIGEGIFMVEIMEPSDLVVRFEFERAGYTLPDSTRFMNRGLDFCLDIFDFEAKPESMVREQFMFTPGQEKSWGPGIARYHLVGEETTPCFRVKKTVVSGKLEREANGFYTGVVTAGSCVLSTPEQRIELNTFDTFFCPAGLGAYTVESSGEVHILECLPPDWRWQG